LERNLRNVNLAVDFCSTMMYKEGIEGEKK